MGAELPAGCVGEPVLPAPPSSSPVLKNREGERVPPLRTLYLYLTAGCNLACRHCWLAPAYKPDGSSGGHLELELLEVALRDGPALGLQSCKLTGGEPTLHPRFAELCELLHRRGLAFWMESNGVLLGPGEARLLARLGALSVAISLDGATAATHDRQRGVAGAFDAALRAIACLTAEGLRPQAILTLTRDNGHELGAFLGLAERLGCGSAKVNLLQPTGRGERLAAADRGFTTRELIEIGRGLGERRRSAGIPIFYSLPPAFWPIELLLRQDAPSCGIHGILGVLADGALALCGIGRHHQALVFGRLGREALSEVWLEHPVLRELRRLRPSALEGVCGRCLHAATCFGACRAAAFQTGQSLSAAFAMCQDAYDEGLFPESRLRPAGPEPPE
jgi:SynChlorMet cassette radical SAM/SPASM protein ScmF